MATGQKKRRFRLRLEAAFASRVYAQHNTPDASSGFFTFFAFLLMRMSVLYMVYSVCICWKQKIRLAGRIAFSLLVSLLGGKRKRPDVLRLVMLLRLLLQHECCSHWVLFPVSRYTSRITDDVKRRNNQSCDFFRNIYKLPCATCTSNALYRWRLVLPGAEPHARQRAASQKCRRCPPGSPAAAASCTGGARPRSGCPRRDGPGGPGGPRSGRRSCACEPPP